MRIRFAPWLGSLLVVGLAVPVLANWVPGGVWLDTIFTNDLEHGILPDGSGGLIVWRNTRGGSVGRFLVADRVSSLGVVAPGWDGISDPDPRYGAWAAGDGLGGLYEGWANPSHQTYLRRLLAAGGADPAWPAAGVAVITGSMGGPALTEDGANGVFVGYQYSSGGYKYGVKRILPSGSLAVGWPAGGRVLESLATPPSWTSTRAVADGSGGAYFFWSSDYLHVQRVTATSAIAPGWPAPGGQIVWDQLLSDLGGFSILEVLPSGPDSFLVAWFASQGGSQWIGLARMDRDGNVDPAWPVTAGPPAGVTLGSAQVVADGSGGAWLGWTEAATVYGTHVRADGVKDHDRIPLLEPGATAGGRICLATGPAGGLIVLWSTPDLTGFADVLRARWLLADGGADPTQPSAGRVVDSGSCEILMARGDGNGGAHAVWRHGVSAYPRMLWLPYPELSVGVPAATELRAFELAVSPNPAARGFSARFTLPSNESARVELADLAGRVIERRAVSGTGPHEERFDTTRLPAGVYFVRLARGRDVLVARVAHTR